MPKPPVHSDFAIDEEARVPEARLISNEASAVSTKVVLWVTFIMLGALVLLCVIGPHIPSGE